MDEHKNLLAGGMAVVALALAVGVTLPPTDIFAADIETLDVQVGNSAIYDEAVGSIAKYNKLEALQAAVKSVQEQEPVAVALWDTSFGIAEIKGLMPGTGDLRGGFGGGFPEIWAHLAIDVALGDGVVTEEDMVKDGWEQCLLLVREKYKDKTFKQLIDLVKANPAKYQAALDYVDEYEEVYLRGEASLRKYLPIIDHTLGNLDSKTGDELAGIYDNLSLPYTEDERQQFISTYNKALHMTRYYGDYTASNFEQGYEALVESTKALDPDFEVNLSGVALLEPEDDLPQNPGQNLPNLPNTGANQTEEVSATFVTVAVVGLAITTMATGIVVIAKRFLLSPLRRKR